MIDLTPFPAPSGQPIRLEVDPAHAWVVGLVVEVRPPAPASLTGTDRQRPATTGSIVADASASSEATGAWAANARCTCPEFCERDHANE